MSAGGSAGASSTGASTGGAPIRVLLLVAHGTLPISPATLQLPLAAALEDSSKSFDSSHVDGVILALAAPGTILEVNTVNELVKSDSFNPNPFFYANMSTLERVFPLYLSRYAPTTLDDIPGSLVRGGFVGIDTTPRAPLLGPLPVPNTLTIQAFQLPSPGVFIDPTLSGSVPSDSVYVKEITGLWDVSAPNKPKRLEHIVGPTRMSVCLGNISHKYSSPDYKLRIIVMCCGLLTIPNLEIHGQVLDRYFKSLREIHRPIGYRPLFLVRILHEIISAHGGTGGITLYAGGAGGADPDVVLGAGGGDSAGGGGVLFPSASAGGAGGADPDVVLGAGGGGNRAGGAGGADEDNNLDPRARPGGGGNEAGGYRSKKQKRRKTKKNKNKRSTKTRRNGGYKQK